VCPFSAAVGNASATQAKLDPSELNKKLKLVWIACGKDDFLFAANEKLIADLKTKGINHVWRATEGAHTWAVWRKYLAEVMPQLFQ
jgi:enterochelin esterase family protein